MDTNTPLEEIPLSDLYAQLPFSAFIIPTFLSILALWAYNGEKGVKPFFYKTIALFYIANYLVGVYFYIKKHF